MKRIFTLLAALIMSITVKAQCPITEAIDFTATDCHGQEIHLFDILDGGQYVLIDFFFTTCGPCQSATPSVVEAYHALGCNDYEVFFMEISPSDNDSQCQAWCDRFGVEYPTIGTAGGGEAICNNYQIPAYPTVILIAPDRSIVVNDIWPISNAQTVISTLAPFGIEEHECGAALDPQVEITVGEVTNTSVEATFTPNEDCASYYILMSTAAEMEQWVNMMGVSLEDLVKQWGIEMTTENTYVWEDMVPNTEYTIYALPLDADGNMYELNTVIATTEAGGGTGVSVIDLEVFVVNDSTVNTIATPNVETMLYHYGLMEKALFDSIGEDAAVQIIREDPYTFYDVDEWTWSPLTPYTDFYAIASGQNANGEWGETTIVPFRTDPDGCIELVSYEYDLYPNPASTYITISSDINSDMEVRIFDMMGRCVKNVIISDSNTTLDLRDINKGVYLINVNGKVEKLIVE